MGHLPAEVGRTVILVCKSMMKNKQFYRCWLIYWETFPPNVTLLMKDFQLLIWKHCWQVACDRDIPLLSWQQHNVSGLLVSSLVNEWSSAILRYDKCSIQINIKILQDHLHPCVTLLAVWFSCKEWFQTLLRANEEVFQNVFNSFWVCCWSQLEYLKENWVFKMYSISTFCLWDNCNNFIRKSKQNLLWR